MDKDQRDKIISRLEEKGVKLPCPRCGNNSFSLIDGYFNQTIQNELKGLVIGGPSIPSVITACNQCGFISQHALGALGLLPPQNVEEKK